MENLKTKVITASMVGINSLPDEVLVYILSLVSPYKDLTYCSRVCRHWRSCVQRVVHQRKARFIRSVAGLKLLWSNPDKPEPESTKLIISKRYSHSAVYDETGLNPGVFVFGGCTSTSTTFNDLWRLDATTREWTRPLSTGAYPSPKACATLVKSKPGELVLFGGWTHPSLYPLHQSWRLFNELHTYDITNMRWTHVTPGSELKPPTMAGHSATVHRGHMVVFGGLQKQRHSIGQFTSSNDVWSFHLDSQCWTQTDIPEPRPKPRYGQSQLYLDENHLLILGGCGGPSNIYNDVWLLVMEAPHWKWVECEVKNVEHGAGNMWCHPACRVGDYAVVLGKNLHPKSSSADKKADKTLSHTAERWNVIPQLRRGLNRGYGAIRRPHPPPTTTRSVSLDDPPPRPGPSRANVRKMPDFDEDTDDTASTSTSDDTDMQSGEEDDPVVKLAVDPVNSPSSSSSRPPPVFRSSFLLNVNQVHHARISWVMDRCGRMTQCNRFYSCFQGEPTSSPEGQTSGGASALPMRSRPFPRMQAFAVGVSSSSSAAAGSIGDPGEPPSAKRKQLETRQRQLVSLKKMEERYKSITSQAKEEKAAKKVCPPAPAAVPVAAAAAPKVHRCSCHRLAMYVLDISKATTDYVVEWLSYKSNTPIDSPEEAILYSLVKGRGELIMFGGIQKDISAMNARAAGHGGGHNENDSVSNGLYFLTPPCQVV
jgi:F-box protein 42